MTTIALVGTLDTKAEDYAWLKEHLAELGVGVVVIDGAIAAETNAPRPELPWTLTALWMVSPLLSLGAIAQRQRRSSPTKSARQTPGH